MTESRQMLRVKPQPLDDASLPVPVLQLKRAWSDSVAPARLLLLCLHLQPHRRLKSHLLIANSPHQSPAPPTSISTLYSHQSLPLPTTTSPNSQIAASNPTTHQLPSDSNSNLINHDLKPTTEKQRTFSGWEMASLWIGLVVGVPSYYLAGSLVDLGMSWWQGIATVVAANVILLIPLILTGHHGTRYGISFPVLARSAFGVRGAHVPTLLRALVGCGWFGIESWIGSEAVFLLLPSSLKNSSLSLPVSWLALLHLNSPASSCSGSLKWPSYGEEWMEFATLRSIQLQYSLLSPLLFSSGLTSRLEDLETCLLYPRA